MLTRKSLIVNQFFRADLMLKKISTSQVRLGMYIQSLEGNWFSHPFWKAKFVLYDQADLEALQSSKVSAVWIDCSKGIDVTDIVENLGQERKQALSYTEKLLQKPTHASTTVAEELHRASQILNHSKHAVMQLFNDARLGKAIDIGQCLPTVEAITTSVARNSSTLIGLARLKTKDEYTYMHSVSVCALMVALSKQLGLDEEQTREAGIAGLLHDIGKIVIPRVVLNKPGKLTDDEFSTMRAHPELGHAMLLKSEMIPQCALDVCLHHHEKVDGTGYPHRLQGQQISVLSRMAAICDVYDAITSNRPYKEAWDAASSLARMAKWTGHFDKEIFNAFVKTVGIYPLGSLVRLNSGNLGVVIEKNPDRLGKPIVRVFFSLQSNTSIFPQVIDLSQPSTTDRIVSREDPAKWGFKNLENLWC
jgi:putative nucleotidyltransferase with HDIG domain|nr:MULTISPECIES: HD-GYP domain-containing protein [Pseudomonas]